MVQTNDKANINGLIRQVSTQNILTKLNAVIDEARCLEEEKGFSLVANEVRGIVNR